MVGVLRISILRIRAVKVWGKVAVAYVNGWRRFYRKSSHVSMLLMPMRSLEETAQKRA